MMLKLTQGQAGDAPVAKEFIEQLSEHDYIEAIAADKAYDSDAIREKISALAKTAVIPGKKNRKEPIEYDQQKYKRLNEVERFFNKLKQYRRVATRYEKLKHTFLGFVKVAALSIHIRSVIVNTPNTFKVHLILYLRQVYC